MLFFRFSAGIFANCLIGQSCNIPDVFSGIFILFLALVVICSQHVSFISSFLPSPTPLLSFDVIFLLSSCQIFSHSRQTSSLTLFTKADISLINRVDFSLPRPTSSFFIKADLSETWYTSQGLTPLSPSRNGLSLSTVLAKASLIVSLVA
jgi:hypothetical protein